MVLNITLAQQWQLCCTKNRRYESYRVLKTNLTLDSQTRDS